MVPVADPASLAVVAMPQHGVYRKDTHQGPAPIDSLRHYGETDAMDRTGKAGWARAIRLVAPRKPGRFVGKLTQAIA